MYQKDYVGWGPSQDNCCCKCGRYPLNPTTKVPFDTTRVIKSGGVAETIERFVCVECDELMRKRPIGQGGR